MFSARNNFGSIEGVTTEEHTMPIIGYKTEYYVGVCWKHLLPKKRWLAADSTWHSDKIIQNQPIYNSRGYLRFDSRSNYWKWGTLIYYYVR